MKHLRGAGMSREYTIKELIKYYVDRYNLPVENRARVHETDDLGIAAYKEALKRIMQATRIGNMSYWNTIKTDGWRRVTIEDFEKQCFPAWCRYIEKNCETYDKAALQADKDKYTEAIKWENEAQTWIEAQNQALIDGSYFEMFESDVDYPAITDAELRQRGHEMMIEAIYDTLFQRFQWEKLKEDMERAEIPDGSMYNADITPELLKARARLQSYLNYIGKKR